MEIVELILLVMVGRIQRYANKERRFMRLDACNMKHLVRNDRQGQFIFTWRKWYLVTLTGNEEEKRGAW